jgi:hypothetical protein
VDATLIEISRSHLEWSERGGQFGTIRLQGPAWTTASLLCSMPVRKSETVAAEAVLWTDLKNRKLLGKKFRRHWLLRNHSAMVAAELTTPSARTRWLRGFSLIAQPPLLCEEGNIPPVSRITGARPQTEDLGHARQSAGATSRNTTLSSRQVPRAGLIPQSGHAPARRSGRRE